VAIYAVTGKGAFSRDFGLRDRIQRAAVSVMSNIAEGFERYSRSELRQFLSIARGSVAEVRCQLHLTARLQYLSTSDFDRLYATCLQISRMLAKFRTSLEGQ
jgi:four helix bundle protein